MRVFGKTAAVSIKIGAILLASAFIATANCGAALPERAGKGIENDIVFTGYLQGSLNGEPQGQPPTAILVEGHDTGLSGELGPFKITYRFTVTIPPGSGPSDNATSAGAAEWTTASGETIFTKFVGIGESTDAGLTRVVEFYKVTGGTGKYLRAQGQFTVKRLSSTGLTSGSVKGKIVLSQAGH